MFPTTIVRWPFRYVRDGFNIAEDIFYTNPSNSRDSTYNLIAQTKKNEFNFDERKSD